MQVRPLGCAYGWQLSNFVIVRRGPSIYDVFTLYRGCVQITGRRSVTFVVVNYIDSGK